MLAYPHLQHKHNKDKEHERDHSTNESERTVVVLQTKKMAPEIAHSAEHTEYSRHDPVGENDRPDTNILQHQYTYRFGEQCCSRYCCGHFGGNPDYGG